MVVLLSNGADLNLVLLLVRPVLQSFESGTRMKTSRVLPADGGRRRTSRRLRFSAGTRGRGVAALATARAGPSKPRDPR